MKLPSPDHDDAFAPDAPASSLRARRRRAQRRRGAFTVEFAIVVPLVFLFLLGAIEITRMNMLRNTVANAAYEAARTAIVPGATPAQTEAAARAVLSSVAAKDATVVITPAVFNSQTAEVTVSVSVPMRSNSWVVWVTPGDLTIARSCKLSRELTTGG